MFHRDLPASLLDTPIGASMAAVEIVPRVLRHAPTDGLHATAIPELQLIRLSSPTLPLPSLYSPGLCIVVQGRKEARLGGRVYRYDPLHALIVSMALPLRGQVIEATPERPYLCVRLNLDTVNLAGVVQSVPEEARTGPDAGMDAGMDAGTVAAPETGLCVAPVAPALLDAVLRLLSLLDEPAHAPSLAPLVLREAVYRALIGALGPSLRALTQHDSHARRIARAIDVLRSRVHKPVRVEELAAAAHMSASSLHHHFKRLTQCTPLQFQKQLRLHDARQLMMNQGLDAAAAAQAVGYESPSQFSREYRRFFGAPPRVDVKAPVRRPPGSTR